MTETHLRILAVGATGSIGRHVVEQALAAGHRVRALTRDVHHARSVDPRAEIVEADLSRPETLTGAVQEIDAVIFTHGAPYGSGDHRAIDYGGVRTILAVLGGRRVRIALMTAIGVTGRYDLNDWKRRGERLVRASGDPYTIVRPGWFDANDPGQQHIVFRQGDTRHAGNPADGVISRSEIARVLVDSLTIPAADHKTLELVAENGPEQDDLTSDFTALKADTGLDGVLDADTMPISAEPDQIRTDLGLG